MLGVTLCLFAQVAGFAHFELVQHVICADHGELVDLVQKHSPTVDPDEGAVAPLGVHLPGSATLAGPDDHCVLAQLVRQVMPTAGTPLALEGAWVQQALTALPSAAHRLAPLQLAPKQSPPARIS